MGGWRIFRFTGQNCSTAFRGIYFLNNRGGYLSRNTESPYRLYLLLDRTERPRWHLYSGVCQMVQVLRADLLDAMKDCLRDLENVKLLSPDDLDILDEKRILRQKIDKLENEDSDARWQPDFSDLISH